MSDLYSCRAVAGFSGPSVGEVSTPPPLPMPHFAAPAPTPATGNLFRGKVSGGLSHTCQRRRGGYGFYKQRHFDMLINLRHHLA